MARGFRFNLDGLREGVKAKLMQSDALAKSAMTEVSHYLAGEARKRAPVDEGHLVNSITPETDKGAKGWEAIVYVASNAHTRAYAVPMHEHEYNLGPNSRAKQMKSNVVVGRKYLTRAISENQERIVKIIEAKMRQMGG